MEAPSIGAILYLIAAANCLLVGQIHREEVKVTYVIVSSDGIFKQETLVRFKIIMCGVACNFWKLDFQKLSLHCGAQL